MFRPGAAPVPARPARPRPVVAAEPWHRPPCLGRQRAPATDCLRASRLSHPLAATNRRSRRGQTLHRLTDPLSSTLLADFSSRRPDPSLRLPPLTTTPLAPPHFSHAKETGSWPDRWCMGLRGEEGPPLRPMPTGAYGCQKVLLRVRSMGATEKKSGATCCLPSRRATYECAARAAPQRSRSCQ